MDKNTCALMHMGLELLDTWIILQRNVNLYLVFLLLCRL
jgi:hypothetical protein